MDKFERARRLLNDFKGDRYLYGTDVLHQVGGVVKRHAEKATPVRSNFAGSDAYISTIKRALSESGVELVDVIDGPRPNAPRVDLMRRSMGMITGQRWH